MIVRADIGERWKPGRNWTFNSRFKVEICKNGRLQQRKLTHHPFIGTFILSWPTNSFLYQLAASLHSLAQWKFGLPRLLRRFVHWNIELNQRGLHQTSLTQGFKDPGNSTVEMAVKNSRVVTKKKVCRFEKSELNTRFQYLLNHIVSDVLETSSMHWKT